MRVISLSLLVFSLFIFSCGDEQDQIKKGEVSFSFSTANIANDRFLQEDISDLVISIADNEGNLILDEKVISFNRTVSEPVLLTIGKYQIVKFLVLNASAEVIYGSPMKGSALAGLVNHPLPIEFEILADQVTNMEIEVVETRNTDPEDLGYSGLSFTIVPTQEMLVSVFLQSNNQLHFVNSLLHVYADGDSLFSKYLGDSINVVTLRTDKMETTFDVTYAGLTKSVMLSPSDIAKYRVTPLQIVFTADLNQDLVLYLPFSGDANDLSTYGNNGIVEGASLTSDRYGNFQSAFEFNNDNDVIKIEKTSSLNLTNQFTLSVWVNLYSGNYNGSRIIDNIISGSTGGYLLDIFNRDRSNGYKTTIRFLGGTELMTTEELPLNEWHHIAVSYNNGYVKIYLDGNTLAEHQENGTTSVTSVDRYIQIGNDIYGDYDTYDPFRGKIDELRIYNRALSSYEIESLAD